MPKIYTNEEQEAFIEVAKTEGISRAIRELGYPGSWATGNRWFESRGIQAPVVSEVHAMANRVKEAFKEKEMLTIGEQGLERVLEALTRDNLTPDDLKKLSEAYQKMVNTMHLVQGKSTNINENRSHFTEDLELNELLAEQERKNEEKFNKIDF